MDAGQEIVLPDQAASALSAILSAIIGLGSTTRLLRLLVVHPSLLQQGPAVSRAVVAQALNMMLLDDLLHRVPAAATYAEQCLAADRKIFHDHGAVRTVDFAAMGMLPRGQNAILRLLAPLGYVLRGTYPLERLRMTGRSFAQADLPEDIAQFFVSELHADRFSREFQRAVAEVTASSTDPLSQDAQRALERLGSVGALEQSDAIALLPALAACFGRQHDTPSVSVYETLLAESPEMAWIATEGNAFNHATDRVADVEALSREQRTLGQSMKDKVEISGTGRVRQTAFHAARVLRDFRLGDGSTIQREVPGSFLEFIARDFIPGEATRTLDLSFDPSNAQAIFKMTSQEPFA